MVTMAARGSRLKGLRYAAEGRGFLATLLISPAVLFIAALVGAPLALAVYLSFTDATAGSLTGKWIGLGNFRTELHDPVFRGALWHTFLLTAISQAIVVVCAGLLAHGLMRSFRGRWILRFLILLPWAAPIALTVTGWYWIYGAGIPEASVLNWFLIHLHLESATNVTNWLGTPRAAMGSIIAVQAWRTIPFATVIFLAGISSIPQEVDDAAAIDGATGLKKFWYVSLPLQLPIALVAVLFGVIFTATDMIVPYVLTNGGPFNSTQVLTTWAFQIGIVSGNVGQGAAIALFMLPLLALVTIGMLVFARKAEVT
ncbi:MAG: sugar ABC transporter permease [Acidobacteriota bacterium]|nr:sugar ABC transporter permease [Acidobacteriota bacterium]MDE3191097.1 sugar ABC transporter permease [Acidobacteriota bacterium]